MRKKEPQKPPEHTSEHVKFPGGVPPDPPYTVWALSPHNPLGGPAGSPPNYYFCELRLIGGRMPKVFVNNMGKTWG